MSTRAVVSERVLAHRGTVGNMPRPGRGRCCSTFVPERHRSGQEAAVGGSPSNPARCQRGTCATPNAADREQSE